MDCQELEQRTDHIKEACPCQLNQRSNLHLGIQLTIIPVTKPSSRNTSSGVVALELVFLALTIYAGTVFIRFIVAIGGSITRPRGRDAETVVARELITVASVAATGFVRMVPTI